jgi:hypothetical protein
MLYLKSTEKPDVLKMLPQYYLMIFEKGCKINKIEGCG